MATGTITVPSPVFVDFSNQITTVPDILNANDVALYRYGRFAFFIFRIRPANEFPVAFTKTHTLPLKPAANYRISIPKTNGNGCVGMFIYSSTGDVEVYSYGGSSYSDWVMGEMWFPIA
ncbi:MAG: hypothetical protein J6Y20_05465 [Lachnospiraceae bacterium]|nr:hypothetical protein [Lachnospiraceae bacterium]